MSHKMKGQKVDLAAFYSSGDDLLLPSAPDPNREPYDRRKGRGGDGRGGGKGFNDRGDRDRDRGGDRDRPRNRNYGDNEGGGGGSSNDGPNESDSGPWQRAGPSGRSYRDSGRDNRDRDYGRDNRDRDSRYGGSGSGGGGSYRPYESSSSSAPASERPVLNLQPRTLPLPEPSVESVTAKVETLTTKENSTPSSISSSSAVSTTTTTTSGDKWDNVFAKSKFQGGSSDVRRGGGSGYNDRGDRGDRGDRSYNDRGYGGGNRDRDRGYNDRGDRNDRDRGYNDRRNDRGDRGDRGYNDRRGYGSTNRYETDPEPIDDPRFVGKFGNSRPSSDSRNSSKNSTPASVAIPTVAVPEKKEDPKAELKKAAQEEKAQRAAAKAEAEKKAKAEKLSKKERELAALEEQKTIALNLVNSGAKGQELLDNINNSEIKPTGPALVAAILASLPSFETLTWTSPDEYSTALKSLLTDKDREQMLVVYELQKYLHIHKFPKIQTKNGQKSIFELTIQLLFKHEVLESTGILKWWDDEEFDDIPGRSDALVQLTTFVNWLNEVDEEDEEEEDNYEGLEPAPRNAA